MLKLRPKRTIATVQQRNGTDTLAKLAAALARIEQLEELREATKPFVTAFFRYKESYYRDPGGAIMLYQPARDAVEVLYAVPNVKKRSPSEDELNASHLRTLAMIYEKTEL